MGHRARSAQARSSPYSPCSLRCASLCVAPCVAPSLHLHSAVRVGESGLWSMRQRDAVGEVCNDSGCPCSGVCQRAAVFFVFALASLKLRSRLRHESPSMSIV